MQEQPLALNDSPSPTSSLDDQFPTSGSRFSLFSKTWLYLIIITISVVMLYGQTLNFDFVNYDDYYLITQNSNYLGNVSNIFNSFTSHAFSTARREGAYYRPLLLTSYIIDYQVWKLNPFGYHLTNILLHTVTALLVFFLINFLVNDKFFAMFASLLFALHPIQVESVAWIAGRDNILLGFFVTLMFIFYILHHKKTENNKLYFGLCLISATLSLFAKEAAIFFLFLIPFYDILITKTKLRLLITRPYRTKYLLLGSVIVLYLAVRVLVFGEIVGSEKLYGKIPFLGRLELVPAMWSEHLSLLFSPVNLSVEHPLDKLIWLVSPWNYAAILIVILSAISIGYTWVRTPLASFGLLWIVVGLIPLLNFFPVAVPIMEHRLYTALIGLGFVLMFILYRGFGTRLQILRYLLPAILIVTAAGLTYTQINSWRNSETLWTKAIENAPTANRPYFNLAGYYYDRQEYDKTIQLLNKYIELKPEDFMGYSKLRQTYFVTGQYGDAIKICRKIIALDPKNQNRYIELGMLFERVNMTDSIISFYQETLRIDSTFYQIHDHLGTIFQKLNNLTKAEYHYLRAIQSKSDYAQAYFHMGSIFATRNNNPEALRWIEEGMKYGRPPADVEQIRLYLLEQVR